MIGNRNTMQSQCSRFLQQRTRRFRTRRKKRYGSECPNLQRAVPQCLRESCIHRKLFLARLGTIPRKLGDDNVCILIQGCTMSDFSGEQVAEATLDDDYTKPRVGGIPRHGRI